MSWLLIFGLLQAWHQGAPMPTPGYGFACAAVGNRVYAIGGLSDRPDSGDASLWSRMVVEAYDVDGDSWITGFAPPLWPCAFAGCAVLDGKIYVIGGTDGRAETKRVGRFDPVSNRWDTVASLPWPRQGIGACLYQGDIYAVGGYNRGDSWGFYKRTVTRFYPDSLHWSEVDSVGTPRAVPGVAVAGNRIYAVGGKYYNDLNSAEFYVPDRWEPESLPMSFPRSGLGVVGFQNRVYAIGGESGGRPLSSVEILDVATQRWQEGEALGTARIGLGAAVVGDRVIVLGGRDLQGCIGTVETHTMPFPGIEEVTPVQPETPPRFPTVFRSRVRIDPGDDCRLEVCDAAGRLIVARSGVLEVDLTEGVYFVRVIADARTRVVRKIAVLK